MYFSCPNWKQRKRLSLYSLNASRRAFSGIPTLYTRRSVNLTFNFTETISHPDLIWNSALRNS